MKDPPCPVYGISPPRDAYIPLDDPTVPSEETAKTFITWVSSYWEPFSSLDEVTEEAVAAQRDMTKIPPPPQPVCFTAAQTPLSKPCTYFSDHFKATSARMTRQELESVVCPEVALRVGHPGHITLSVYGTHARRSLFDTKGLWPRVKAIVLWADMSCAYCPWGAKVLSEQLKEPRREGEVRRDVEIVRLENANHFVSLAIIQLYRLMYRSLGCRRDLS